MKMHPRVKMERADQIAGLLLELINGLKITYAFEPSFKMYEKTLLGNRFLFGLLKKNFKQDPYEKIVDICQRIDMPHGEIYLVSFIAL